MLSSGTLSTSIPLWMTCILRRSTLHWLTSASRTLCVVAIMPSTSQLSRRRDLLEAGMPWMVSSRAASVRRFSSFSALVAR